MKRARRFVLYAFLSACVLTGIGGAAAWVSSYFHREYYFLYLRRTFSITLFNRGEADVEVEVFPKVVEGPWDRFGHTADAPQDWTPWGRHSSIRERLGFVYERRDEDPGVARYVLFFPIWCPTCAALLPPLALAFRRAWRRGRRGDGTRCRSCGYDMRATPLRCPECGQFSEPALAE